MGLWKGVVWAFARNTEVGRKALGRETLAEQAARQQLEGLMARSALQAFRDYQSRREADSRWRSDGSRGHSTQYEDGDVRVEVVNGYSRDYDQYTTDIKVVHRDNGIKEHLHIVFDERGNEIVHEWRPNH